MLEKVKNTLIQTWDHFGNTLTHGPNMVTYSHIYGIEKVPCRLVFYIEHTLIEQKCPIKA